MTKQEELYGAVRKIAWGYILIHVHINLGTLDVLPDWLGYYFMYAALPILTQEEETAKLLRPLGLGLTIWNGIDWVLKLVGAGIGGVGYLLSMVVSVVALYFHFQLLTNLAGIAERYGCPESGRLIQLRNVRTVLATIAAVMLYWIEANSMDGALVIVLAISQLVIVVWLCSVLFALSKSLLDEEVLGDEGEYPDEDQEAADGADAEKTVDGYDGEADDTEE
ncbi:MAG: hypothetical protein IJZ85_05330 [Lachnospiraceae bacterium]|nr:hypothetical protein [Lachnospiraceae bacterium]